MKFCKYFLTLALAIACVEPVFNQSDVTRQWPQFRGYQGKGILDGTEVPVKWDLKTGENVLWKTAVPGLAHSSPIVWDNLVFVTSAVCSSKADSLKIGLYGDVDMANDLSAHQFKIFCLDKKTGKIIWDRIVYEGVPKERRHTKSTYANPTPATDGKHLVVSFGSNGLYCYDFNGNLLWKKDLGNLATGPYNESNVEWGYSSSPVIHAGQIVVQCDLLKNPFLATFDILTGKEIRRIARDAVSSWGSPAIVEMEGKCLIILNGYPYITAYDFKSGAEVWKIGNVGDAPAPTAVFANNLVYVNSAHGKYSPILAINPDAAGDITLATDSTKSKSVAWSFSRGGAYMASPLVYDGLLYNMQVNGLLTAIDALTGAVKYKQNTGKAFSASGVASGNKIYFAAETGEVFVIQAGPEYKLLAENNMDDICMASPGITDGTIIFRTQHSVIAIGKK